MLLRRSRIIFELIWAKNKIQSSVLASIYAFFISIFFHIFPIYPLYMAVSILFLGWTDNRLKYVLTFFCRFWKKFNRLSGGVTCWMWKKPIGSDENRISRVWVLYRNWLYREKISMKSGEGEVGGACWRYRGPIAMDDSWEWWIWAGYRDWPIRRESGSRKCVKNRVKWRILLVWDAPWTVLAENLHGSRFLYKKADSELKKIGSQAKTAKTEDFAGKFGTGFFHIFRGGRIQNRRSHMVLVGAKLGLHGNTAWPKLI